MTRPHIYSRADNVQCATNAKIPRNFIVMKRGNLSCGLNMRGLNGNAEFLITRLLNEQRLLAEPIQVLDKYLHQIFEFAHPCPNFKGSSLI